MEFFKLNNRITDKWTDTTAEAFGDTPAVRKGRAGELFVIKVLSSWGWDVIDYENDKSYQVKQIDIGFKSPDWYNYYTGSIKANMDDYGYIFVYDEWIHKTKADRIFHCNPETGWLCWYDTARMQEYYKHNQRYMHVKNGKLLMTISPNDCKNFIKRRNYSGVSHAA